MLCVFGKLQLCLIFLTAANQHKTMLSDEAARFLRRIPPRRIVDDGNKADDACRSW
jgi:hypothetical protein